MDEAAVTMAVGHVGLALTCAAVDGADVDTP